VTIVSSIRVKEIYWQDKHYPETFFKFPAGKEIPATEDSGNVDVKLRSGEYLPSFCRVCANLTDSLKGFKFGSDMA
jgi:hypothetical protein